MDSAFAVHQRSELCWAGFEPLKLQPRAWSITHIVCQAQSRPRWCLEPREALVSWERQAAYQCTRQRLNEHQDPEDLVGPDAPVM
jgi:hypothetical protein